MHYPQVLVYENDGRFAEWLRPASRARRWSLREPREIKSCLRLLEGGHPSVLVLSAGNDLIREMSLLEQASSGFPDTAALVIDTLDNPQVARLAWDLGARYVLSPPLVREQLVDLVNAFLPRQTGSRVGSDEEPVIAIEAEEGQA